MKEILGSLLRDARFARRNLARTPVVTCAAILSIAIGIAATTAVFSVVNAALLRPLPFEHSDRLMMVYWTHQLPGESPVNERWSWPRSRMLRERAQSFEQIATFSTSVLALTSADADPEPVNVDVVSSAYFPTLRVRPVVGREFDASVDETTSSATEIVLGYDLWRRRFAADPAILGATVGLNGVPFRVIGVAPREFQGLSGRAQAWIPATAAPRVSFAEYLTTNQNFISVVARLRDGASPTGARTELSLIARAIDRTIPSSDRQDVAHSADLMPVRDASIDPATRQPMLLLSAAAACLLLLACANVAGLLLGRATGRRREIAIRVATGASRARIMSQLLIESGLIAVTGALFGVLLAIPLSPAFVLPAAAARGRNFYGALGEFATPRLDWPVLAFCALVCAIATIAFGLLPAIRATRVDLNSDLKEGAAIGGGRGGSRSRQLIVAFETALAVLLLSAAGLLMVSWQRIAATPVGFDQNGLLTFLVRPSEAAYPPARAPALIDRVLAEIEAVPSVEAATVDGCFPVGVGCANSTLLFVDRTNPPANQAPPVLRHYVGPNHFRTLRIPLIRGRVFTAADGAGANRVAIISELAARRFWPNEDPVGKRVYFGGGSSFDRPDSSAEIVGIVGNVAYQAIDQHPFQPDFYTPYAQFTYATRMVLVRTRGNPPGSVADIRRAVRRADPSLALFEVRTMEDRMSDSWSRLAHQARLVATFATIAVLLAAMGIFTVITQTIADRRRELAVRLALGASNARIIATAGRHGAGPALIGLVVGLGVSVVTGRVAAAALYATPATDPVVLASVMAVAGFVVMAATLLGARRALATQPLEALRTA